MDAPLEMSYGSTVARNGISWLYPESWFPQLLICPQVIADVLTSEQVQEGGTQCGSPPQEVRENCGRSSLGRSSRNACRQSSRMRFLEVRSSFPESFGSSAEISPQNSSQNFSQNFFPYSFRRAATLGFPLGLAPITLGNLLFPDRTPTFQSPQITPNLNHYACKLSDRPSTS